MPITTIKIEALEVDIEQLSPDGALENFIAEQEDRFLLIHGEERHIGRLWFCTTYLEAVMLSAALKAQGANCSIYADCDDEKDGFCVADSTLWDRTQDPAYCSVCKGLAEYYMLKDKIWDKIAKDHKFLCFKCVEAHLGRALKWRDFQSIELNEPYFHRFRPTK